MNQKQFENLKRGALVRHKCSGDAYVVERTHPAVVAIRSIQVTNPNEWRKEAKMAKKLHELATLYVDQYGSKIYARSVKELKEKAGPGKVSKIYREINGDVTHHCGYSVGDRWFDAYAPVMVREAAEHRSEKDLDRLAMRKAHRLIRKWGAAGLSLSGNINGCWVLSKYTDQPGNPIDGNAFCGSGREVLDTVETVVAYRKLQT